MSMQTTRLLLAATLCCSGGAARAAGHAAPVQATESATSFTLAPGAQVVFSEQDTDGAVKNAPYTATMVKERQQILGDGNQISHRTDARVYRDSAGRTREESLDKTGALRMVAIRDPVAGERWMLNPHTKTATRMSLPPRARDQGGKAPPEAMVQVVERHSKPDGTEEMLVKRVARANSGGAPATPPEKITIYAESLDMRSFPGAHPGSQGAGLRQLNPVLSGAFTDMKWASHATKRELRPRDIDGIRATGQLRSYDIPAGELGNRNAMVVSDETWYAPELHITLMSKHSDPRTGDSIFRIENLKREEPAPALFVPPSDYAIKDLAALRQHAGDRKPPQ